MIFKELNGKAIREVVRLSDSECTEMGWYKKPVVIIFTDGSWMIPVCDDECNDGGSMIYHNLNDEETIIYTEQYNG